MANFEVQFDLKGTMIVKADSYEKAEKLAKKKLNQYKESMGLHFQKDISLIIDDIEEVS
jgi:hypothetical protein